jgi:hypothetical protein
MSVPIIGIIGMSVPIINNRPLTLSITLSSLIDSIQLLVLRALLTSGLSDTLPGAANLLR